MDLSSIRDFDRTTLSETKTVVRNLMDFPVAFEDVDMEDVLTSQFGDGNWNGNDQTGRDDRSSVGGSDSDSNSDSEADQRLVEELRQLSRSDHQQHRFAPADEEDVVHDGFNTTHKNPGILAGIRSFNAETLTPVETVVKQSCSVRVNYVDEHGQRLGSSRPASETAAAGAVTAAAVPMECENEEEAHGFMGAGRGWSLPLRAVTCDEEARPGYATRKAHEYAEAPEVFRAKIRLFAELVRASENCVVYSGAGISTSSGIGDYATRSEESLNARPKLRSPIEAQPTPAHRALAAMHGAGYIRRWIQQNHDGLPQKAGFPQSALNEIHGAWYDPSNPVVPMSGSLRGDLFEDLLTWEEQTDLCLVLGTSLCGMNADRLATTPAAKARRGVGQGAVIVGLQQTQYDGIASVRIFATIDDVMRALVAELGLEMPPEGHRYEPEIPAAAVVAGEEDVFMVPYDEQMGSLNTAGGEATAAATDEWQEETDRASGHRYWWNRITMKSSWQRPAAAAATTATAAPVAAAAPARMRWNLAEGARVRMTVGMHEGAIGEVVGKNLEGHYRIRFMLTVKGKFKAPMIMLLGSWWAEAAAKGEVPQLPMVNIA